MKNINKTTQYGLSLIELMIAITLGLVITAGVLQVFLSTKQSYKLTTAHAVLQDNARLAIEQLSKEVRQAGYAGCRNADQIDVKVIANSVSAIMDKNTVVTGNESVTSSSWSPSLTVSLSNNVKEGTDVISLMRAGSCGGNLVGNMTSSNANIQIYYPNACGLDKGKVAMVADCQDAHIFTISNNLNINNNTNKQTLTFSQADNKANHLCKGYESLPHNGACSPGTAKLYNHDAEIYTFSSVSYYIRKNTSSLYVFDSINNGSSELVEGIQDMQVMYGLDDNDDNVIDRTENAKTVNDNNEWPKVISVEISLLAETLDDHLTVDNQTYTYNGINYPGNDGKLRRVFTTTIAVRNRIQ